MPPEQIGKYKVLSKIGQGAMGEVFKAHDPILDRYVAIKTIAGEMSSDEMLRTRFHREAQSAARLNHPNIIKVFDFGEEAGTLYMAMELLEGNDLKKAIGQRLFTSLDEKLRVLEQVAEGLAFAHAHDVVHRDLKPANIHLQTGGQVKIMDFGLARLAGSEITRTGMVMGTPHYMSPEQVRGERADARSDVFAVGCVMYELFAYRKPFDADSMHSVLFKVLQEHPPSVKELVPDLPIVLYQVVEVALSKDPAQRFQDGRAFRDALGQARQAILNGQGEAPLRSLPVPGQVAGAIETDSLATGAVQQRLEAGNARRPPGSGGGAGASRAASPARPVPEKDRAPLFLGIGVGVAVLFLVAIVAAARLFLAPAPTQTPAPQQLDRLTQALVGTQLELATKKLTAGDYHEALRQAERALALDPKSAGALQVKKQAQAALAKLEQAVAEVRATRTAGDGEKARAALWNVMRLDPDNAVVNEVASEEEAQFRSQAEDARRAALEARAKAEQARVAAPEGVSLMSLGDASFKAARYLTAARHFLKARVEFQRASQPSS
jgi:tRNA A-37 threonylcarbamoyl transferase component Bud32/tetratricopeptide (TPR) repeat protein